MRQQRKTRCKHCYLLCRNRITGIIHSICRDGRAFESTEARLYKALDKLEAVIQHNESDINTWLPLEYELQQTYAQENANEFPYLKELRMLMLQDTLDKIEQAKEKQE